MDAVSYSHSAKQAKRIKKFINDPDSSSGIITVPKVIASGETVTVPAGRVAVLPNVQVDGTMTVNGEVFIPSGSTYSSTNINSANGSFDVLKTQGQNVSPFTGFKNYIINGNFDVWQRAVNGVSTDSSYTADMWKVWASGANTNWTRASSADFDSYSKFVGWGLKWYGDPASAQAPIEHRIESINAYKLSGKKVTISFLAKSSSVQNWSVELATPTAIDNFIANTDIDSKIVNITATTQRFSLTFDLTSIDCRKGLNLVIRPNIPASLNWIAQVQLEEGSVATTFESRPYGLELSLCQRYYESHKGIPAVRMCNYTANSMNFGLFTFKTSKRVVPTVNVSNAVIATVNSAIQSGFTFGAESSQDSFFLIGTKVAHGLTDACCVSNLEYTASAEL